MAISTWAETVSGVSTKNQFLTLSESLVTSSPTVLVPYHSLLLNSISFLLTSPTFTGVLSVYGTNLVYKWIQPKIRSQFREKENKRKQVQYLEINTHLFAPNLRS